ncbi:NADPH:quinone oxidoreductase family protein [Antricoccus suffuscus]|nr:NADPH:quinone oxidoreductase family protein [Antricoccus suffuscus]
MKAWISHLAGGPESLALEEVSIPECAAGDVLIRVEAVGINFPDSLLIRDLYQVKPPRPFVPGSEFCGVVEGTGSAVTRFRVGDVVSGTCGWGAMAEYVVQSQDRCFRVPDGLPRAEAATFLFAYATAYHALHDVGHLRAGETLAVLGAAGGVGTAAIDVAAALGANVIACASSQSKLDFALSCGASAGLVYDANLQDGAQQRGLAGQLKDLTPGGINVVVDPVGGSYTEPVLRSIARGGRHLVIGFTAGIPRVPLNIALLKSCQILGVDWRTFIRQEPDANAANVEALLAMWQAGQIEPKVTERFTFEDAPAAVARLESRRAVGKIAVSMRA